MVTCETPPGSTGSSVPLSLSMNGGANYGLQTKSHFSYILPMVIDSIIPLFGSIKGGTLLRIKGSGFSTNVVNDKYACRFGLNHSSPVSYVSDTEVQCMTPLASMVGPQSLVVHAMGEISQQPKTYFEFNYVQDFIIDSISPSDGPVRGGTSVVLHGGSFINQSSYRAGSPVEFY